MNRILADKMLELQTKKDALDKTIKKIKILEDTYNEKMAQKELLT